MKKLKTNSFQAQLKEEITTLSNEELIQKFKEKKQEQNQTVVVSFAMTLAQIITVIKRELIDRGLDYHQIIA